MGYNPAGPYFLNVWSVGLAKNIRWTDFGQVTILLCFVCAVPLLLLEDDDDDDNDDDDDADLVEPQFDDRLEERVRCTLQTRTVLCSQRNDDHKKDSDVEVKFKIVSIEKDCHPSYPDWPKRGG